MQLVKSKDVDNVDLGLEMAKNLFPKFYKWFEDKLTQELNVLHDEVIIRGNMTRCLFAPPIEYINKFRYKNIRFFATMIEYINKKGYLQKSNLKR